MADENTASVPAGGPASSPAETPPTDPRAAALAILKGGQAPAAQDPKAASAAPAVAGGGTPASESASPSTPETADGGTPAASEPGGDRLSRGFAKLAREKAALFQREEALKTKASALERWEADQAKIKADTAAILDVHGVTLEQLAEAYLARQAGAPAAPTAEDRVAKLEAQLEADRKAADDRAAKEQEQLRAVAREKAIEVVKDWTPADKFPTIAALGEHEQVYQALGAYAQKHALKPEQVTREVLELVAGEVERALADEISGVVEKVPHIAARKAPPATQQAPIRQPDPSGAQGTSSTSLASSAVSGAPPPQEKRTYSKEELRKMALAHFAPRASA